MRRANHLQVPGQEPEAVYNVDLGSEKDCLGPRNEYSWVDSLIESKC